jgi:DNA-binding response OmpR family regulator
MIPRPRVLVVEDDPLALMMLTLELQLEGFEAVGAETAREALHLLCRPAPPTQSQPWDALVCDLDLRDGSDGYLLAQSARGSNPGLAVIFTSGVARPDFHRRKVPDADLAPKPFIPEEIALRLRGLLTAPPQA